jgi:hypothetical protein
MTDEIRAPLIPEPNEYAPPAPNQQGTHIAPNFRAFDQVRAALVTEPNEYAPPSPDTQGTHVAPNFKALDEVRAPLLVDPNDYQQPLPSSDGVTPPEVTYLADEDGTIIFFPGGVLLEVR